MDANDDYWLRGIAEMQAGAGFASMALNTANAITDRGMRFDVYIAVIRYLADEPPRPWWWTPMAGFCEIGERLLCRPEGAAKGQQK